MTNGLVTSFGLLSFQHREAIEFSEIPSVHDISLHVIPIPFSRHSKRERQEENVQFGFFRSFFELFHVVVRRVHFLIVEVCSDDPYWIYVDHVTFVRYLVVSSLIQIADRSVDFHEFEFHYVNHFQSSTNVV